MLTKEIIIPIKKILVANRGEIALRIMRACRELSIPTVAIYSLADASSLHHYFADESVCIGEAPAHLSYLNIPRIIAAAEISGADAIHPGYGFLAENPNFAKICKENNIAFIGPSANIIAKMGDKSTARDTMLKAGLPIIPGSPILQSVNQALLLAKNIKYPVMLKASAGGGGKGMRVCHSPKELKNVFHITQNEAKSNFNNPNLYLEKFIKNPRHVEVQILSDLYGNCLHLGERDCSIQRRHQKLIEETPSPFISKDTQKKICQTAVEGAQFVDYFGAGTMEFLVDENQQFYFMEMNTRIQVEHTISELLTGIDIVKQQIIIAKGKKLNLAQKNVTFRGHVIECRINCENPFKDFRPSPGKITRYHLPQGLGVRIDSHIYNDYTIPSHYDSMIAKLIVWGYNREEAISRMHRSLDEIVIEGPHTTIPFHKQFINSKDFLNGNYNTQSMEKFKLLKPKKS